MTADLGRAVLALDDVLTRPDGLAPDGNLQRIPGRPSRRRGPQVPGPASRRTGPRPRESADRSPASLP